MTRHSILGSSGRVGYLGGANGAWVMADVATGAIVGGGAVADASQMTHDLGTGETSKNPVRPIVGPLTSTDPLVKNEFWIRIAVLTLAAALAPPFRRCTPVRPLLGLDAVVRTLARWNVF